MKPENPMAFPRHSSDPYDNQTGMSLRQWLVGKMAPTVWAEMCAEYKNDDVDVPTFEEWTTDTLRMVDAMIAAEKN